MSWMSWLLIIGGVFVFNLLFVRWFPKTFRFCACSILISLLSYCGYRMYLIFSQFSDDDWHDMVADLGNFGLNLLYLAIFVLFILKWGKPILYGLLYHTFK